MLYPLPAEKEIKMKRITLILTLSFLVGFAASAQFAEDVLRYSRTNIGGTARYMGTGGAFGALGADFTVASINPAGLGLYKSSELTITPSVFWQKTESSYNGSFGSDSRSNFHLGNIGMVYTSKALSPRERSGFKRVQFSVGLNRLNDFNNRIYMQGTNPDNSFLDTYLNEVQGPPQIPFESLEEDPAYGFDLGLAWWTFLLDIYGDTNNYGYYTPVPYGGVLQEKTIETKGSMNEWVFSVSTNYNDRFYIGMTFALPYIRYTQTSTYRETDVADTIFDFKQFNRTEYLETRGNGFTFKLGMIYRVTDWLRLGAAFHSPTWYHRMQDYYWATMESFFDNGDNYYEASPDGNFDYRMETPLRAIGSAAIIFGQQGLISLDYEYRDYGAGKLKDYNNRFNDQMRVQNDIIRDSYRGAHNFRVGTEWRYQVFSFRGGFGYEGSPYESGINDGETFTYSAGIGFRTKVFFADLAYVHSRTKQDYFLYLTDEVYTNPVNNTFKTNNIMLTLGIRY